MGKILNLRDFSRFYLYPESLCRKIVFKAPSKKENHGEKGEKCTVINGKPKQWVSEREKAKQEMPSTVSHKYQFNLSLSDK